MHKIIFISFIIAIPLISCQKQNTPYNLSKPSSTFVLDHELNEISGLHAISDSILLSVQDEMGIIYYLNANNGEIMNTIKFGKGGDFEGITKASEELFALESNGNIYKIKDAKTTKYTLKKEGKYDFEGLCFDHKNNILLIACKTHAKKDKQDHIYIYGFSLSGNKYLKSPIFKIKKEGDYKNFKPSGIAIHPNGDIYILSSTAKMIIRISGEGKILGTQSLSASIFNQPEGITFLKNGDLYISNEKRKSKPTLLKFKMQNN